MNKVLHKDLNDLDKILANAKDLSMCYLNELQNVPSSTDVGSLNLPSLPSEGVGAQATQALFEKNFYQNIVSSSGSRYWGFVTGGTTPASIAGDWLTSVFDQNTQAINGIGDASANLELHTIKMLLQLFNLPDNFIGGMVSGATMSNFTGLGIARQWLGREMGLDIARDGVPGNLKIYSATPHSSAIKCLSMLGIGRNNITIIPTMPDRECMDVEAFEKIISHDASASFILISSAGTVNTVDYDNLALIASLKNKFRFWWHIDAAFGAFAACSHKHQHLLNGWEAADSITIDFHKWLNVPYDSAVILTRIEHAGLQVQTFQNSAAPYLGDQMVGFNYLNFVPENSRRFRALPVWFTLMAYGKEGYRDIVESNIALAKELGERITALEGFELAAPVRLNTVCFTVKGDNKEKTIRAILRELSKSGLLFLTPTTYQGINCLRAALVNWRTTKRY